MAEQTDKMVAFERSTENGQYVCKAKLIGLTDVANVEKLVPREWINPAATEWSSRSSTMFFRSSRGNVHAEGTLPSPFREAQKIQAEPVRN